MDKKEFLKKVVKAHEKKGKKDSKNEEKADKKEAEAELPSKKYKNLGK